MKDAEEIALLNEAQSCTDVAFDDILERLAVGMTERQVALELEHALRRAGADGLSFESIVAFGEQSAEPHHHPTHRVLEEGDVIKMDFAGLYGGLSRRHDAHDRVRLAAARAAEDPRRGAAGAAGGDRRRARGRDGRRRSTRSRARWSTAPDTARSSRTASGTASASRSTRARTSAAAGTDVLPVGAVMTVEPGVYVPGLGGVRIEDMVEVGEDGCRVIGTSTRELIEL